MKKILFLVSGTLLLLTSCTNDYDASCLAKNNVGPIKNDTISPPKTDSIPVIVEPILLKKLVHNYANGASSTIDLSYDGTKVIKDVNDSNFTYYTYTGDIITKIEKADLAGDVYYSEAYFYANGKVDYVLSTEFGKYYKTKYVYNNDGSIFFTKWNSDSLGNEGEQTTISGRYVFSGGNMIQKQSYDAKNNPRLNTSGSNLLTGLNQLFSANNVTRRVTTAKNNDVITQTGTTTYSYEYDANGYPTKSTETLQIGDTITTETSVYSY
ncbi:hypothetical protein [Flavobacterium sp. JAS]|uniref:hypothetical protein n=1 Tax=Flavobacterium sp. JAS TaxID=2897329 RepID=UPI001E30B348|nr:hypothetical protein [Flavobacterium sp. JAS]MCD0469290.1 hypothetical protein [Flavobacterium sp. JAS]